MFAISVKLYWEWEASIHVLVKAGINCFQPNDFEVKEYEDKLTRRLILQ